MGFVVIFSLPKSAKGGEQGEDGSWCHDCSSDAGLGVKLLLLPWGWGAAGGWFPGRAEAQQRKHVQVKKFAFAVPCCCGQAKTSRTHVQELHLLHLKLLGGQQLLSQMWLWPECFSFTVALEE